MSEVPRRRERRAAARRGAAGRSQAPQLPQVPPLPQTTQPPLGGAPAVRPMPPQPPVQSQQLPQQQPMPPQRAQAQQQRPKRARSESHRPAGAASAAQRASAQRASNQRPSAQRATAQRASPQSSSPRRATVAAALARSRAWARPAGVGARLGAYSVDAALCLILAAAAWVVTQSPLVGGIVLVEAAVILLVVEARTGATVGNLLLRLRTARDDAPYSAGMGRALVRGLVGGAGSLVALIGGWIVVATSAADPERMGRSLADRAGRTLVVRVPSAAEREMWNRNAQAWALHAPEGGGGATTGTALGPGAVLRTDTPGIAPPSAPHSAGGPPPAPLGQPVTAPRAPHPQPQPQSPAIPSQPQSQTPAMPSQPQPGAPQSLPAQGGADGPAAGGADGSAAELPPGVVPVDAPIAPAPAPREVGTLLLLSFDTGQRARLRIPTVVNLGRRPEPSEADDQLVVVEDPAASVSKTHLRLEYRGDSVWVTDLGSTNGSEMVDDTGAMSVLASGARMRLEDGASVRIGQRSFTVATITGEL
ncbi:RDD family protein [Leucobacter chromiiresistens]